MEKYKPLKLGDKSYCLSKKNNKDTEVYSEFNVVLTNNIFKNNKLIQDLKSSKTKLELNLMKKKEEYKSILIYINNLIDMGMETQDDKKLEEIIQLVKEYKNKKIFTQQIIDEINKEITSIDLKIINMGKEKNSIIQKYKLDSGGKFRNIVCPKEDEEELRDALESFGCLCD